MTQSRKQRKHTYTGTKTVQISKGPTSGYDL